MKCEQEIKRRIGIAKEAFRKKKHVFCGSFSKELRKRLIKCFVWSIVLYGAETWTLRKSDQKRLEAFEMWVWRRMEKVSWVERKSNDEVLARVGERKTVLNIIRKRKINWLGHWLRRNCILRDVIEGMVEGKRGRGRRRFQLIDDI